jgi:hypothetical protein
MNNVELSNDQEIMSSGLYGAARIKEELLEWFIEVRQTIEKTDRIAEAFFQLIAQKYDTPERKTGEGTEWASLIKPFDELSLKRELEIFDEASEFIKDAPAYDIVFTASVYKDSTSEPLQMRTWVFNKEISP